MPTTDPEQDVMVQMNGACWSQTGQNLEQANVSVGVTIVPKKDA
jgi:hypothetical protein